MGDGIDPGAVAALETAVKAGDASGVDIAALVAAAAKALRFGAHQNAVDVLRGVVALDGEHARAWAYLGMGLEALGRREEATQAYETALSFDDEDFSTAMALARLHTHGQRWSAAEALLNWMIGELEEQEDPELYRNALTLHQEVKQAKQGAVR
jgi:Flp pilus assembly protein TadD